MWFWGVSRLLTKIRSSGWTRIWKNIYSQALSIVNGLYLIAFSFIYWNCNSVPFYGSGLGCNLGYVCSSLIRAVAACVGIIWGGSANSKIPPSQHRGIASCVYQAGVVKHSWSSWWSSCFLGFCVGLTVPVVIYMHKPHGLFCWA